jgi:hypothetical protein
MRVSLVLRAHSAARFVRSSFQHPENYLHGHFDSFEIIVVDDGGEVATPAVMNTLSGLHARVMRLPGNRDRLTAIKTGMLERRGTSRIFTGADLPHDLEALPSIESQI